MKIGIGCQVHYIPVYLQPYYGSQYGYGEEACPNAGQYCEKRLSLALYPTQKEKKSRFVSELIKNGVAQ